MEATSLSLALPKVNTGLFSFAPTKQSVPNGGGFDTWLHEVSPSLTWDWAHLAYIRRQLDRVTTGEIKRLMLFMPPRHGKTEQVTVRYPVWRLKRDPTLHVIVGAYNQTLVNRFSRKARRIAETQIDLSADRSAVEEWETSMGGTFRAVGVGSGITGQGGDLVIIDDPVKSREEANSETYRERVWDWYTDDLYTRLEPGAAIILIMTRWHESDLAGRILESEDGPDWTVISLPAEAEANDPLGRELGAALCPERYDVDALERIHAVLGNSYYALYQQRPTPPEGGMFKRHWFEIVDNAPRQLQRVRYWDKAGSSDKGDYTVGALLGRDALGQFYVLDVVRGQWSALERETVIKQTAAMDAGLYGGVTIWQEQEPGSGGLESAQATVRNLAGYSIRTERVTGDKATRAEPFAAQCGALNVRLVAGAWNAAYVTELCAFPYGSFDDQVDASSGAFNKLAVPPRRRPTSKAY